MLNFSYRTLLIIGIACAAFLSSEVQAKTFCMGAAYANAPADARAKLQSELRKQGRLGPGDKLAACSAPAAMSGKPNPKKKASCLKDCDDIKVGIEIVCGIASWFVPGASAACALGSKGAENVCPLTCEKRYG